MIHVDPKETHMYPYKREAKGDLTTYGKEDDKRRSRERFSDNGRGAWSDAALSTGMLVATGTWKSQNPPLKLSGA